MAVAIQRGPQAFLFAGSDQGEGEEGQPLSRRTGPRTVAFVAGMRSRRGVHRGRWIRLQRRLRRSDGRGPRAGADMRGLQETLSYFCSRDPFFRISAPPILTEKSSPQRVPGFDCLMKPTVTNFALGRR